MKKVQIEAKIIANKRIGCKYFKITLAAAPIAVKSAPGQFVMIKPQAGVEPLLRRPLGVHGVRGKNIELFYEVVGPATAILAQKKPGEVVDVIGPLGQGFCYEGRGKKDEGRHILVAGGMGVAPLIFLAEKLREIQNPCLAGRQAKSQIQNLVLIGAKTKSHILCEKEFRELGCDVKIATDDGSRGFKGRVTDLLCSVIARTLSGAKWTKQSKKIASRPSDARNDGLVIYACGPRAMLQEITHVSQKYIVPAQVSLEEHMSCGFGACLGCAVNTIDGYKQVCKDGPVFDAQEIIW